MYRMRYESTYYNNFPGTKLNISFVNNLKHLAGHLTYNAIRKLCQITEEI